jgi:predicted RNA-binding Zn-ribbon protein involved in translation (DUF1610 family)
MKQPHQEQVTKFLRTVQEQNAAVLALKPKFCGSRRRVMTGIACPQCGEEVAETAPPERVPSNPQIMKIECPACGWKGSSFTV